MTDEHTAALGRARASVLNALEILLSITNDYWPEEPLVRHHLECADAFLGEAIDGESKP